MGRQVCGSTLGTRRSQARRRFLGGGGFDPRSVRLPLICDDGLALVVVAADAVELPPLRELVPNKRPPAPLPGVRVPGGVVSRRAPAALHVRLPEPLARLAKADATRRGVDLRTWITETLEAVLAGHACRHAGRVVEPPAHRKEEEPNP
jgi:hypothetical protein